MAGHGALGSLLLRNTRSRARPLFCEGPKLMLSNTSGPSTGESQTQEPTPQGEYENLSGASMEVLSTMYRSHPSQRFLLTRKDTEPKRSEEEKEDDFSSGRAGKAPKEHKIAAWRRYLTHPGVPEGTVFEREMMATRMRLDAAQNSVHKHKLRSLGVIDDDVKVGEQEGSLRPQKGIMAVVEDKIQLSMMQGEFDDLQGRGKPLDRERTPGLDRTTDLFMDVLKRNGVKPEWIERQNRIAEMTSLFWRRIQTEYARALLDANPDWRSTEGGSAMQARDQAPKQPCMQRFKEHMTGLSSLQDDLAFLNREIDMYNLQVPSMHLQRLRLKLDNVFSDATSAGLPTTLTEAHEMYRSASREGLMGVTCLMDFRSHQFDVGCHDSTHGRPSASFTPYWLEGDGRQTYQGPYSRRKPRHTDVNPLMLAVMVPIDGLASYLARMFSI